jgi:methylglyoxal/glyoxal reductase
MKLSFHSKLTLNNGVEIPWLGFGTAQTNNDSAGYKRSADAIKAGYRLFDSAAKYRSEASVGKAIKESGIPREEFFVTSKVWTVDMREDRVYEAFEESLRQLQMDYVDMYMLHWPIPGHYTENWKALERIYKEGRAKAIGVSNFTPRMLDDLYTISEIMPAVNQCECHPRFANEETIKYCQQNGIAFQSFMPLGRGIYKDNPIIAAIAKKHNKSFAQVLIRWQLQKGILVIPKSMHYEYMVSNRNVFDFELDEADMEQIKSLNVNKRTGSSTPDCFNF